MSIFKDTIKDDVYNQIKARERVVSGENDFRSPLLPWYLSKNSWVRMTSFVDYNEGTVIPDGKGGLEVDTSKGNYSGDQLSRKYVLQGGTLYQDPNRPGEGALRKNLVVEGASYGASDIDTANGNQTKWYRTYGIRPMPGITSVEMNTVTAYGSIYSSKVKFYAWDTHQLNELELLFMRPGYSVLLEWGWSQYVDNSNLPQVFSGGTIDPFDPTLNQQAVYDKLQALRERYDYNYDGMLGYVKNFNWNRMSNGGYECYTELISIGEVMTTLRIAPSSQKRSQKATIEGNNENKVYYDDYETILLSIKYSVENSTSGSLTVTDESQNDYSGNFTSENAISIPDIQSKLTAKGWTNEANNLNNEPFLKILTANGTEQNSEGKFFEYISLGTWVAIMDSYFSYKVGKDYVAESDYVKFQPVGGEDYCLAGRDSVSTDPGICILNNPLAFKSEFPAVQDPNYPVEGINPLPNTKAISGTGAINIVNDSVVNLPPFYDDSLKVGKMAYIYVNLDLLLGEYRSLKGNNDEAGVIMTTYVKRILSRINHALGGLNNFNLSTAGNRNDTNVMRVVDINYLEPIQDTIYSGKKQLNLTGLNTIFKEVKIESQIFPNQSTIAAIAAQSRANLGDVYNSSQVYLNAGLKDRLSPAKWQGEENTAPDVNNTDDPIYQKLLDFLIYVKKGIIGQPAAPGWRIDPEISPSDTSGFLRSFLLKYDGEIAFKALIPFKLTVTLEGIGGFVIGQIFTVEDNGVLPKNYIDKHLGFIITGIKHNLDNNIWNTTLETQICILDQQEWYKDGMSLMTNGYNRDEFYKFLQNARTDSILYPIVVDFVRYQFYRTLAGYLYASVDNSRATTVVNNYLIPRDREDLIQYYQGNLGSFLINYQDTTSQISGFVPGTIPAPSGNVRKYDVNEFGSFMVGWITDWESKNPTQLDIVFGKDSSGTDQTLRSVLTTLKTLGEDNWAGEGEFYDIFKRSYEQTINTLQSDNFRSVWNPLAESNSIYLDGTAYNGNLLFPQEIFINPEIGTPVPVPNGHTVDTVKITQKTNEILSSEFALLFKYWDNLNIVDPSTNAPTAIKNLFQWGSTALVPTYTTLGQSLLNENNALTNNDRKTIKSYAQTIKWISNVISVQDDGSGKPNNGAWLDRNIFDE